MHVQYYSVLILTCRLHPAWIKRFLVFRNFYYFRINLNDCRSVQTLMVLINNTGFIKMQIICQFICLVVSVPYLCVSCIFHSDNCMQIYFEEVYWLFMIALTVFDRIKFLAHCNTISTILDYFWSYMYVCVHTYMYVYMYVCIFRYMYIHVCMCVCMYIGLGMYVYIYVCMHVCIFVCMHACMYERMHTCMYEHMHTCMYACMYVCM